MLHVVLYQPAIPPNTGNVSRQCVGMNAHLHLIGPLGFNLDDTQLRRAGLDHWPALKLTVHPDPQAFLDWLGDRQPWLVTKFGSLRYDRVPYRDEDILLLGNENRGLPRAWVQRWPHRRIFIPILGPVRSYNLSNAAALVLAQACSTAGLYEGVAGMPGDPGSAEGEGSGEDSGGGFEGDG